MKANDSMRITTTHVRQIRQTLNTKWRGFRKDVALRSYEVDGKWISDHWSFNYDLRPDCNQDLADLYSLDDMAGEYLDLREGSAVLDVWLYRHGELELQVSVYIRRIVLNKCLMSLAPISDADVLRAAVRQHAA